MSKIYTLACIVRENKKGTVVFWQFFEKVPTKNNLFPDVLLHLSVVALIQLCASFSSVNWKIILQEHAVNGS